MTHTPSYTHGTFVLFALTFTSSVDNGLNVTYKVSEPSPAAAADLSQMDGRHITVTMSSHGSGYRAEKTARVYVCGMCWIDVYH